MIVKPKISIRTIRKIETRGDLFMDERVPKISGSMAGFFRELNKKEAPEIALVRTPFLK